MEHALLKTLAYADVFDYPLTAEEIHLYLAGQSTDLDTVRAALDGDLLHSGYLARRDGYYMLRGRETIAEVRQRRATIAAQMWPRALYYGAIIGELPFARMVAVTGALAVENVEAGADIDYMIVTEPGRLWLCRALVVLVVRWAARLGDILCPNYLVSEKALVFEDRSLYTAHEVIQMVPVTGLHVYARMRELNDWVYRYLPNARALPSRPPAGRARPPSRTWRGATWALGVGLQTPLGPALEHWERERKIHRLRRGVDRGSEAAFTADCCKGHFDSHGSSTLAAFSSRLSAIESAE